MDVLAVIPAMWKCGDIRGQSIKLMNNKPLIFYSINTAKKCKGITDVAVISNDDEIIEISKGYGVDSIKADKEASTDFYDLNNTLFSYINKMEKENNRKYGVIVKLHPACPLLLCSTLENALNSFINSSSDVCISVTESEQLSWKKDNSKFYANESGLQYLQAESFFMIKREHLQNSDVRKKDVRTYEISSKEAIEIRDLEDWIICENHLKRKKIVYRADGYKKIGMGHIYRGLTLSYQLAGHNIIFATNKACKEGVQKIKESGLLYTLISDDTDFFEFLKEYKPDIVINDCLNTTLEYVNEVKKYTKRVVSIEDLGTGIVAADAVINSLYESVHTNFNIYSGEKYICLREEFLAANPIIISKEVKNVLVVFGGTDPSNLTQKIYNLAMDVYKDSKDVKFTFLSPVVCKFGKNELQSYKNIEIVKHTKRVTNYMKEADIAFTSQGRTIFELASMGIPSIVMAQNIREQLHMFANMENGFLNLGLGSEVSYDAIKGAFYLLLNNYNVRKNMQKLMLKHDLKKGIHRVKNIILGDD